MMKNNHIPPPWQSTKTETGPELPLFNVIFNWFQNPRTGRSMKRLVLESPDWVNIVPITGEGKVVVVRQFRFGIGQTTTEIPGGIVDPGEDSAKAAGRELLEETGYTSSDWHYLGAVEANPAIQNNLCHHWLAKSAVKTGEMDLGNGEDIIVSELTLEEIHAEIESGRLRHSLALSALSRVFNLWDR